MSREDITLHGSPCGTECDITMREYGEDSYSLCKLLALFRLHKNAFKHFIAAGSMQRTLHRR